MRFQAEYSFRVTHWRDVVPHIPMGKDGGYHHHRQEVLLVISCLPLYNVFLVI